MLPLVRSDAIIRKVTITTEFDSRLPCVRSDRVQLQQVILDLLLNGAESMKGCRPDDRTIVVRTAGRDQSVVVSVEDCGVGVTEQVRPCRPACPGRGQPDRCAGADTVRVRDLSSDDDSGRQPAGGWPRSVNTTRPS